jgi:hypothetical protein
MDEKAKSWRDDYEIHPAANFFPMMPEDELRKLGEDIRANGLKDDIVVWCSGREDDWRTPCTQYVLDGRNRLAAMELVGHDYEFETSGRIERLYEFPREDTGTVDPYAYVISKNILRRHLSKEQQADLIVQVIKAQTDFANLARSVERDSNGRVQGSTKDPIKDKAVTEGKKHGISERTIERAIAKERGPTLPSRKSKPTITTVPVKITTTETDTPVEVEAAPHINGNGATKYIDDTEVDNIGREAVSFLKRELEHASSQQIMTVLEMIVDAFPREVDPGIDGVQGLSTRRKSVEGLRHE